MIETSDNNIELLMVDDDKELSELVQEFFLAEGGYNIAVRHNGEEGVKAVASIEPDIVIMDITMPVMNGLDALKEIRKTSAVPILMLTARGDEIDRIMGLEFGADDYVPKPCNLRELAARVKAVLRRTKAVEQKSTASKKIEIGDLIIDPGAQAVFRDGQAVNLTGAEYLILEILAEAAGTVVSKEDIAKQALGRRLLPYDRSVDIHIGHLRKKLKPLPNGLQRIKTVRGQGYFYSVTS